MTWSAKRKLLYIGFFFLLFLVTFFWIYWKFLRVAPDCFDGILNQGEQEIDCGGPCLRVCSLTATKPNIVWARALEVSGGVYNLVAMIENPNFGYEMTGRYAFKIYDTSGLFLNEFYGRINLKNSESKVVFVPSIRVGAKTPGQVFFELIPDSIEWTKGSRRENKIFVRHRDLSGEDRKPKLSALVENRDNSPVRNIQVIAVLLDELDSLIQSSSSFVQRLNAGESRELVFTWPEPLDRAVSRVEMYIEEEISL